MWSVKLRSLWDKMFYDFSRKKLTAHKPCNNIHPNAKLLFKYGLKYCKPK